MHSIVSANRHSSSANTALRSQQLASAASLKAAQITTDLQLVRANVRLVATRFLIGNALKLYNNDTQDVFTNPVWTTGLQALTTALNAGQEDGILLQAAVFPRDPNGMNGSSVLLRATSSYLGSGVLLPYQSPNGSDVYLGDLQYGYPADLYPNLTYNDVSPSSNLPLASFAGQAIDGTSMLLLGPWKVNSTLSMISLSLPISNVNDDANQNEVLGFLTVVVDATFITQAMISRVGLSHTGTSLLVGPTNVTNKLYWKEVNNTTKNEMVRYVFAPNATFGRHGRGRHVFNVSSSDAIYTAMKDPSSGPQDPKCVLKTENEENDKVSIGYARVDIDLVDWLLLVELSRKEVFSPAVKLRNVLLFCVFGVAIALVIFAVPIAHYASAPIRHLRDAARGSYDPPASDDPRRHSFGITDPNRTRDDSFFAFLVRWWRKRGNRGGSDTSSAVKREFMLPNKVAVRKLIFTDELSELSRSFNAMVDELRAQYTKLEERVQQRTIELELSKRTAEEANSAKTLFVANISHELKTPLNVILGIAQTVQTETKDHQVQNDMALVCTHGGLLLKLIEDLLAFSKNQVGHSNIVLEEDQLKIEDLGTHLKSMFDKVAQSREIDLELNYVGSPPETDGDMPMAGEVKDMTVWGDKLRILQVLINLTSNSLKFTPAGGAVTITIRYVGEVEKVVRPTMFRDWSAVGSDTSQQKISHTATFLNASETLEARSRSPKPGSEDVTTRLQVDSSQVLLEFSVQDTGPGIPPHLRDRVFEPFFQGDMELSKKFQGTGLGLSICQQLAAMMKGKINLYSKEGSGSTFTMRIPLKFMGYDLEARTPEELPAILSERRETSYGFPKAESTTIVEEVSSTDSTPSRAVSTPHGGKVLIAEDNAVNQQIASRMLRLQNIETVHIADDGEKAVAMVLDCLEKNTPYDLILMDVQMPNMDGIDATIHIRQAGFTNPIIALSAYSDNTNVEVRTNYVRIVPT